jgi:hypothetical protein
MHTVVSGLTPRAALPAGWKVDVEALPAAVLAALKAGTVNRDPLR